MSITYKVSLITALLYSSDHQILSNVFILYDVSPEFKNINLKDFNAFQTYCFESTISC